MQNYAPFFAYTHYNNENRIKRLGKIVQTLRKHGVVEPICDMYSIIKDKKLPDDLGWIIPNECLSL